jgi:exodeoxyribonuclease VII large subunit
VSLNTHTNGILSVSDLNLQLKSLLEVTFARVRVEGEVSNLTYHASGHVYFSIKDDNATVRCVLFRGNALRLKFRLTSGQKVIVEGAISVYSPRGEYQINCFMVEPSGVGALSLAFHQLKEKLEKMGWCDHNIKKPLPQYPQHIVLVTSATSAALQDMRRVAEHRWRHLKITLIDTVVQGEESANNLVRSIQKADRIGADIIVIGRGGGSLEDLWSFNEETVAKAIYESKTPVVSAVGHETDVLISDLVADLRAPTPSAAMEMILPDHNEIRMLLDQYMDEILRQQQNLLHQHSKTLRSLIDYYMRHSIETKISLCKSELNAIAQHMSHCIASIIPQNENLISEIARQYQRHTNQILLHQEQQLYALETTYQAHDPQQKTDSGYVQLVKNNHPCRLESIHEQDTIVLQDVYFKLKAIALKKTPIEGKQSRKND